MSKISLRVEKLLRFTSRTGGMKHSCAVMVFNSDFELTYANPIVSRLFGLVHPKEPAQTFSEIFSEHNAVNLRNLVHQSSLSKDWEQKNIVANHISQSISRRMDVYALASYSPEKEYIFVFKLEKDSKETDRFIRLIKTAALLPIDAIAKIEVKKDGDTDVLAQPMFSYFEQDLCDLFRLERHELIRTSLGELIPTQSSDTGASFWDNLSSGFINGHCNHSEFMDSAGNVFCASTSIYFLEENEEFSHYLIIFSKATPEHQNAISPSALGSLLYSLNSADVGIACLNQTSITFSNPRLLSWVKNIRKDQISFTSCIKEVCPKHRRKVKNIWQRAFLSNGTYSFQAALMSDRHSLIDFTLISQTESRNHGRVSLLLIGIKRNTNNAAAYESSLKTSPSREELVPEELHASSMLLTASEKKVASLIKTGNGSKSIAKQLGISPGTVNIHRKNIRKKLNLTGNKVNLANALLLVDTL